MHKHLADDDTPGFLVSAMIPALMIHSQDPYRGRVQDLTDQVNASDGHRKCKDEC
jgi:hypothetical protein